MHKLAQLCVRRPVFATVLVLSLVVVGYFAYLQLGVDRFPKVDFPTITITTTLTGAAPEEIETDITDKIEESVNTISGIDQLQSISSEGVSQVIVQFVLEKNADVAAQEVRDKVNMVLRNLPADADPPIIQKFDPDSVPVLSIALDGPAPIREITEYADKKLRRRLESLNGVGQVLIVGGRPRQINVVVDTEKLSAVGVTTAQIIGALQSQNVQIPGGKVEQGLHDLTLRTYGRVTSPGDFANVVILSKNGYPVKIGDVAHIEDSVAEPESVASVDGKPAVVLQIRKQSGTNTVEVVEALKERTAELQKDLPKGWKMRVIRDQSEYVISAVNAVKEHLILGSLFAALIVWFFLSSPKLRTALMLVAATLAVYFLLFGFHDVPAKMAIPLRAGGVLVALGMLTYFFRRSRPTVISAVAIPSSIIATFAAMKFENFTLNVITLLALTLAVGIAISLLVSFTLTPMMSSRWLRREDLHHGTATREHGIYGLIERTYLRMLDWSMRHRWVIVISMFLALFSIVPLGKAVNKNFLPQDDESQFAVSVRAPEGSSLQTTQTIMDSIASRIRKIAEVERTVVTIGDDPQITQNLGSGYVKLVPVEKRKRSQFDVMADVRANVMPQYRRLNLRTSLAPVNTFGGGVNAG